MSTSYHMVHYRRFSGHKSSTLETLCRAALGSKNTKGVPLWERVSDRVYGLPDEPNKKVLLNKVADLASAVFGEMCLVQNDGLQALLKLTAANVQTSTISTAQIFSLQEQAAPANSQFVRGMVYWLSIGNHLFFVKTQSMTAEHLRQYFDWLFKFHASALFMSANVLLQAEFDRSQVGGDIGDIQSLKVSGNAIPMSVKAAAQATKDTSTISETVKSTARRIMDSSAIFEQAVPVLEALIGKKKTKSLVESLGPNEYLAVDASVKVRGRRTTESKQQLHQLANELADLTDGKVQVEGRDGKISNDDAILRTRMPFNIAHEGSNFLEFDNVADQLQEVYTRYVKDGKIPA